MVVQRTLNKIEELKERPHQERRAVALYVAVGVVAFLTLIWGGFTLHKLTKTAIRLNSPHAATIAPETSAPNLNSAASAAAAVGAPTKEAPRGYTASSTNGKVDIIPTR